MEEKIKVTFQKLRRVGTSWVVTIPQEIVTSLGIAENDRIKLAVKLLSPKPYKCMICENTSYFTDEETPYCSICGEEKTMDEIDISPEEEK